MAEDEVPEEFDFEELKETIKEHRRERREQASYEWVETVREAGELYRDSEDIKAVSNELNTSEETTREALTVYRLIFEEPPEKVAGKASPPGRAFFSLETKLGQAIDEDEYEPVEELLREYVGSIYLEHNVESQPVGDPPEESTPPTPVDFSELSGKLLENFTPPIHSFITDSAVSVIQDSIRESRARMFENMTQPVIEQRNRMAASLVESAAAQQREMMQSVISTTFPPLVQQIQRHQNLVNTSIVNSATSINFPEPVLADLATLHPGFSTMSAAGATFTPPDTDDSVTTEVFTTTVEAESSEVTTTTAPPTGAAHVTMDATLPDPGAFTTELVFEIPMMVTKAILSTGQARIWFDDLHEDYQIDVVKALLVGVAVLLTQNPAWAGIAVIPARSLRRIILSEEDEE